MIVGLEAHPGLREWIEAVFPTHKVVQTTAEVRVADYDCLFTSSSWLELSAPAVDKRGPSDHLCIFFVADQVPKQPRQLETLIRHFNPDNFGQVQSELRANHPCAEVHHPDASSLGEDLATAVERTLLPEAAGRERHPYFRFNRSGGDVPQIEALIAATSGAILAGRYERSDMAETWLIPPTESHVEIIAQCALDRWTKLWPERFPEVSDWRRSPLWRSVEESAVAGRIAAAQTRRQELLDAAEAELTSLTDDLAAEQSAGDQGPRRLLTAQGGDLAEEVAAALSDLGFVVEDEDQFSVAGNRLEDLRVRDPSHPDWIAICEVRGYSKGAKSHDLLRLERFAARFALAEKRLPDARWYIVNQFLNNDPSSRTPPFASQEEDLREFAGDGGLVLESTDLYKLRRDAVSGDVAGEEARASLRGSTGLWTGLA